MIDLTKNPYGKYNGKEQEYVLQALSDDPKNKEMPWTKRLENAFCQKMGVKYAIAVNSGTSGLHAALYAAGVKQGDEVIGPALTVIMDAYATIHLGATPVFADVIPETMTIDPEDVKRKITPKTKAIIVVSLQGLPVDMDPIMAIAREHNIVVVEDSAQTIMGKYKGRLAGTIGDINMFSFENKKHMTCGSEGGMLVTNNPELAMRARKFAGIGYKHLTADAGRTSLTPAHFQNPEYERFDTVGLNYRMSEISAAVGLGQFERIDELVARRIKVGKLFQEAVKGCRWLLPQVTPEGYEHSYYTFAARYFGEQSIGITWREFYQQYREMGGDGFYGACQIPYNEPVFRGLMINGHSYEKGLCPKAEEVQRRVMQFKTNYRNLDVARQKVEILHTLIYKLEKR